jgi:hypothetical protein
MAKPWRAQMDCGTISPKMTMRNVELARKREHQRERARRGKKGGARRERRRDREGETGRTREQLRCRQSRRGRWAATRSLAASEAQCESA